VCNNTIVDIVDLVESRHARGTNQYYIYYEGTEDSNKVSNLALFVIVKGEVRAFFLSIYYNRFF
jgi:hypothetical protein